MVEFKLFCFLSFESFEAFEAAMGSSKLSSKKLATGALRFVLKLYLIMLGQWCLWQQNLSVHVIRDIRVRVVVLRCGWTLKDYSLRR